MRNIGVFYINSKCFPISLWNILQEYSGYILWVQPLLEAEITRRVGYSSTVFAFDESFLMGIRRDYFKWIQPFPSSSPRIL